MDWGMDRRNSTELWYWRSRFWGSDWTSFSSVSHGFIILFIPSPPSDLVY